MLKRNETQLKECHRAAQPQPTSRLLCLPFEIRYQIFVEVLGERAIDIIESRRIRKYAVHDYWASTGLDTALLLVCRQTYEECTRIIYRTNTFSFLDSYVFEDFFTVLTPKQIGLLGRLEVSVYDCGSSLGPGYGDYTRWGKTFRPETLSKLQGLRYLRFNLGDNFLYHLAWSAAYLPSLGVFGKDDLSDYEELFWNALNNFRDLPLKTLVVDSSVRERVPRHHQGCETEYQERVEQGIAHVRQTLLTPWPSNSISPMVEWLSREGTAE